MMIQRLFIIVTMGVTLTGCFMAPLAFVGPATSGFSTASIIQSGVTSGASLIVKKSTGKTISEHALDSLGKEVLQQTYVSQYDDKVINEKSVGVNIDYKDSMLKNAKLKIKTNTILSK